MGPMEVARKELLDTIVARMFDEMDRKYVDVIRVYCPDREVEREMMAFRRDFSYAAWELMSMQVIESTPTTKVQIDGDYTERGPNRHLIAKLIVRAKVHGRYSKVEVHSWQELVESVVEPLFMKIGKSTKAAAIVPKKTIWATLNKMTGNEPMIGLQKRLNESLEGVRKIATENKMLEVEVERFKSSKRNEFLKRLHSFFDREAHPFTEEEDIVRTWREILAKSLVDD